MVIEARQFFKKGCWHVYITLERIDVEKEDGNLH